MYLVYVHACVISGKHYVGVTSLSMEERWKDHLRMAAGGNQTHFHRAIRSYGTECWLHEVLEEGILNKEEAYKAEAYWVEALESTNDKIGYNMRGGGLGGWDHVNNHPDIKMRRSQLTTGEKNGRAKLTVADVKKIHELYASGIVQTELARMFGVSQYVISAIHRGILWKSVPNERHKRR